MCDELALPLSIIYSNSWKNSVLAQEWKRANVTALLKKVDRKIAGNHRPVSLTCIVCKVLESILRQNIVEHMKDNKLFSKKQYGFISGRSTVLQLLTVVDKWTETLDKVGAVDVAYYDFMKAFHKVGHKRLVHTLKTYNFGDCYQA